MKICIPTEDDLGLNGTLAAHFGRAPFFTVVDPETKATEVIANTHTEHAHGHCNPLEAISRSRADVVICRGLGRGALMRLSEARIPVLVTDHELVSEALAAFDASDLLDATLNDACGGSGNCHGDASHHH